MAGRTSAAERARRLLGLLSHLQPGATMPLAELASALGSSPEEVAADLQTLSMCGVHPYDPYDLIDVFVEDDGHVHVHAEVPALGRPVRLTPRETRALAAALRACGLTAEDPLLRKLEAASSPGAEPEDVQRLVRAHAADPQGGVYAALARAIEEGAKVEASYLSSGAAEPACRTLQPHALAWRDGSWYLSAFCESAFEERTFRLDRFLWLRATGEPFERPEPPPDAAPDFTTRGLPAAVLRFAPGERASTREWPGATFEAGEDGATLARVPYSSLRWLAREVVARLGAVTVLEPAEVREAVRALAEEELAALG
ncbi:MAG: WYL domain-containing protein [Coriobacteriia bacterium]|nr:WYL domain-containing protein [Coriobacteriia bacterium]